MTSPVIGILANDIDFDLRDAFGVEYKYFISSANVKWVECGSAKVVPIWANRDDDYYKAILQKVNGVFLPPGKFWFNDTSGDGNACYSAKKIYDIAVQMNDKGIYLPIFGISMGMELLFYSASGGQTDSRATIPKYNGNFPLKLETGIDKSRMFGKAMPSDILKILSGEKVNYFSNIFGVTKDILKKYKIENDWQILATAVSDKTTFITAVEHKKYPFYGLIPHPEKNLFEHFPEINHSLNAVRAAQYFANFFVEECKKNKNKFIDVNKCSIYNYEITFTEPKTPQYTACYLFTGCDDMKN